MRMHNPPHPGEVLRELCLKPLGLSVSETARAPGISPEMAIRQHGQPEGSQRRVRGLREPSGY